MAWAKALALAAAVALPAAAGDGPQVEVRTGAAEPEYDFSMTREQLAQLAAAYSPGLRHEALGGLTLSQVQAEIVAYGKYAVVSVTRPRTVVFVASEYPEGSCAFRLALAHERGHVEIGLRYMDAAARAVAAAVSGALAAGRDPGDAAEAAVTASGAAEAEAQASYDRAEAAAGRTPEAACAGEDGAPPPAPPRPARRRGGPGAA
jgi:hypothetical protein